MSERLGISGRLASRFLDNALTPLIALAAMLLGVFAVLVTPREEEPQIDVTMAGLGLYLSTSGSPSAFTRSLSQAMRPHRLSPHGMISTAPLPVSSYQRPASRGNDCAWTPPARNSAGMRTPNLEANRDRPVDCVLVPRNSVRTLASRKIHQE